MTFFVADEEYAAGYERAYEFYFAGCSRTARSVVAKNVGVMVLNAAISRLQRHNPAAHIVAVLRNPVERAYSSYWYSRRRGWEDRLTFEEGLDAETARSQAGGALARHTAYVGCGRYPAQLEMLWRAFGADRVHIFLAEDLSNDPVGVCRSLFTVLRVDTTFAPDTASRHNRSATARSETMARLLAGTNPVRQVLKRFVPRQLAFRLKRRLRQLNEMDFAPPPMSGSTRERLLETFAPENLRLAELIGRDLTEWSR